MEARGIVILGGGYAGVYAALGAARARGDARVDIRLVSADDHLVNRPRLYEAGPGPHLRYPLAPLVDRIGVGFTRGRATAIDVIERTVTLEDGAGVPYDRLVIALGSMTARPPIRGIERAYDVDTYEGALALDRRLRTLPAGSRVTVIGTGFTGLELATELAARFQVTLVERADVLAPTLGPGPRAAIHDALRRLSIELRLSTTVDEIGDEVTVWCGGMVAHPLARTIAAKHDELGRLFTEPSLAIPGIEGVYAAGDVAHAMTDDDHVALMSCQHAIRLGQFAGHNAVADVLGRAPLPYRQPAYRTCLDLGGAGAVLTDGWERRVLMAGDQAKARKREINTVWAALPAASDRARLLAFGEPGTAQYRPREDA